MRMPDSAISSRSITATGRTASTASWGMWLATDASLSAAAPCAGDRNISAAIATAAAIQNSVGVRRP